MQAKDAARILEMLCDAYRRTLPAGSARAYGAALVDLADPEAAEVAAVELVKHERDFPPIAAILERYEQVRRQIALEEEQTRLALEEARIPPEKRQANIARGAELVRQVLAAKGIAPPVNPQHADAYDPPLTVPETRHGVHTQFGRPEPTLCRFCREIAATPPTIGEEAAG